MLTNNWMKKVFSTSAFSFNFNAFIGVNLKNRTLTNIQDTQQEQQRSTQLHKDAHLRKVISKPPPLAK